MIFSVNLNILRSFCLPVQTGVKGIQFLNIVKVEADKKEVEPKK